MTHIGKSRQRESRFKTIDQAKEGFGQGQDEEANQSYESITQGLNQKDNFEDTSPAE